MTPPDRSLPGPAQPAVPDPGHGTGPASLEVPPSEPAVPSATGPVGSGPAASERAPGEVRARPERLRRMSAVVAGVLVLVSAGVTLLSGRASTGTPFGAPDRIALFGLGLVLAAGVLLLGRPALVADGRGLRVRNLGGEREVPWPLVRGVSVRGRSLWASLDLVDDETLPLLAVQVLDGERAVATVRALRALQARYGASE